MRHLSVFLLSLIFITGCSRQTDFTYNEGNIFGTWYHFKYDHPTGKDLHQEILQLLDEFDQSLSTYNPDSLISRSNRNDPLVELDELFLVCFNRAQEISADTDGAFDITVGPLVNAWGFGSGEKRELTPELIAELQGISGYRKVRVEGTRLIKDNPEIQLDVNAVAKGYAVDVVGQFLIAEGCEHFMVEIGGEVVTRGRNPDNVPWRIGINKPIDDPSSAQQELHTVVSLNDVGMATSGNYRNFYIKDGVKYAHTIDPRTGYPVQHSLLSATVLAPDCMTADAYATAFMVMGLEQSVALVDKRDELEALFIYSDENGDHQSWQSEGF
ncbi:MAG: FAD:protein FMN transferase [Puniceicoccaceae bacterium]